MNNSENKSALQAHKRIIERNKKIANLQKKDGSVNLTTADINELKNNGRK